MPWQPAKDKEAVLDRRSLALAGEPTWVRSGLKLYSKGSDLNAHDWIQLVQSAGDYLLRGLYPLYPRYEAALLQLRDACNLIINFESPVDEEDREGATVAELKLKVVEAMCELASVIPETELAPMLHIILHVPDCIHKWNSVRNFWSFFIERST